MDSQNSGFLVGLDLGFLDRGGFRLLGRGTDFENILCP